MSTEQTVESDAEREGSIVLNPEEERDILAGVTDDGDGVGGDEEALEQLRDTTMGYQLNSEREVAWIRRIDLGEDGVSDNRVTVEFLLPSGDTFERKYWLPDRRWPDDNDFVRLLDEVNQEPATMEKVPGSRVDVAYEDGMWQVVGLDVDADSVTGERSRAMKVLDDDEHHHYQIAVAMLLLGGVLPAAAAGIGGEPALVIARQFAGGLLLATFPVLLYLIVVEDVYGVEVEDEEDDWN